MLVLLHRIFASIGPAMLMVAIAGNALAQGIVTPTPFQTAPAQPALTPQQLDPLLAPIALYPDQLLSQILIASTYPLEVVEAARWLQDPRNAALRGDQLVQELEPQDWDPSVKALVPFPRILQMMNQRLDWMQRLGNAFLAQPDLVMASVQRLRHDAMAAGKLRSTSQQTVRVEGDSIVIEPATPAEVYVPYYDSSEIYGAWPYPEYPAYFFPPPPGYIYGSDFFWISFPIIVPLWGWCYWNWHGHEMIIDRDRFNRINQVEDERLHRAPITSTTWEHDPYHRRGVAYSTPQVQQRFAPAQPGAPEQRRGFRGFGTAPTTPGAHPTPTGETPTAPIFHAEPGANAHAESERGRSSIESMPHAPSAPSFHAPSAGGGGVPHR